MEGRECLEMHPFTCSFTYSVRPAKALYQAVRTVMTRWGMSVCTGVEEKGQ